MHGCEKRGFGAAIVRSRRAARECTGGRDRGDGRRWCSPRPAISLPAARSTLGPGSPMTGQMYVEYFIPQKHTSPYPIVMIHGGSQTGTNFTGTPDGREGWAQYFLRRGHAVYVVDQVARGRSAHFSQSQGTVQAANLKRTEQRFVAPKRSNLVAAGQEAHAMAGPRQAGRCLVRPVLRHAISFARQLSEAAGAQPRRRHRAVRPASGRRCC